MRLRTVIPLLLGGIAAVVLWRGAAALLVVQPPAHFQPTSLNAAANAEPISPIPRSLPLDARKIALGRRLFHDSQLSGDNSIACASCHVLSNAGADGRKRSLGIRGQLTDLNSPTVFNTVFNFRQFWDGRAATLEEQVDGPLHNPKEMASNWPEVLAKLGADRQYIAEFRSLYGGLEADHVKNAIAEFERSLLTPGARFDRYLEGERGELTSDELKGYQLFKNYGCVACHQGVNVGGNLYQRLGVVKAFFSAGASTSAAHPGRATVSDAPEDQNLFKVPSLRNVVLTAPYFHDGSIPTLELAVAIMGEYQLGVVIPPSDVALIVGFLHTLTGKYEGPLP